MEIQNEIIQLTEENVEGTIILAEEVDGTMTFVIDSKDKAIQIKDLICNQFGFDELIFQRVMENGFDIESLLLATDAEINDLFPAPLLGTRAKFKFQLNVWRKNASNQVPRNCREWIQSNTLCGENRCSTDTSIYTMSPSSSHVSYGDELNSLNCNSLLELLNKTEKGLEILEFYKREQILDQNNKSMLISVIVESYSSNLKEMSMKDIETATNAIQAVFPTEEKKYYMHKRGHGLNPTGKLHDKAVNARIKLRSLKRKQNEELVDQEIPISDITDSCPESQEPLDFDVEQTIIWLTHNNEPWNEVQDKWSKVLTQRQKDIKSGQSNILTKWPLFKHALGHTLVEIDYESIKPFNKSRIFELWAPFVEKIVSYFKMKIRDKVSLSLLKELEKEVDTSSRGFIIFYLLHALLKPPVLSIGKKSAKRGRWKPTIKDAQESCFINCTTAAQYGDKVDLLRKKYLSKGLTLQPVIIVIGPEIIKLEQFYTFYDGILYKFSTFIKCFDVTFKLFHVMNFKYPREGKHLYAFVQTYFYNFHIEENANIKSLLNYLNQ